MRGRRVFVARHDGLCPECGDAIAEGLDEIVMTDDGAIHLECDDEIDERNERATFPL